MGYQGPQSSLLKNMSGTICPVAGKDKRIHCFTQMYLSERESISSTGIRTHYDVTVQHVSHNSRENPQIILAKTITLKSKYEQTIYFT